MKIAIVKLSALGDIIHAMVVLQFIKNHYPKIEIDWVVEKDFKELLESHPDINKVHVVNIKNAKKKKSIYLLLNELRRVRKFGPYDFVIDLQGLIKSALITCMLSSDKTFGFDKYSARESLAAIFYNQTNKVTIRPSQFMTRYGPGSLLPADTCSVTSPSVSDMIANLNQPIGNFAETVNGKQKLNKIEINDSRMSKMLYQINKEEIDFDDICLLYTSPRTRDGLLYPMPS